MNHVDIIIPTHSKNPSSWSSHSQKARWKHWKITNDFPFRISFGGLKRSGESTKSEWNVPSSGHGWTNPWLLASLHIPLFSDPTDRPGVHGAQWQQMGWIGQCGQPNHEASPKWQWLVITNITPQTLEAYDLNPHILSVTICFYLISNYRGNPRQISGTKKSRYPKFLL